jgi:hypothetical protein
MMTFRNNVVRVVAVIVVPIERQIITWNNFDGFGSLDVAEDIAA